MRRKRLSAITAGVVALSLVAAACGDDDDGATETEAPAETEAAAEEPAETEAPAETDAPVETEAPAGPEVAVVVRRGPPEFSGGMGRRRRMEGPPVELLNYKDVAMLSRFMTEQGKILPKRTTKVTAAFQRQLGTAIKRARYLALLSYMRREDG